MKYNYYKHQLEAIEHIKNHQGNCLIADPPRLGKTAPTIGYAFQQDQLPCLIVCPNSVVVKWQREVKAITESDAYIIKNSKAFNIQYTKFIIIPYSLLAKQAKALEAVRFKQIIYDEVHRLKNSKAQVTKAAHKYLKNTPSILLTGTPILNAPKELWSLFVLLGVSDKVSLNEFTFQKHFCNGHKEFIHVGNGQYKDVWRADGISNEQELNGLIQKHTGFLRRSFQECWGSSCQKIIQGNEYLDVKLTIEQDKILAEFANTGKQTAKIKSIRRDIGIRKINKSVAWIKSWLKFNSGKLIVFAHHINVQNALFESLEKIKPAVIKGGMKTSERDRQVELFQNDDACRLAILSIKASSEGITLDRADHVVFVEYDYTPASNWQAMNRGYSIGREAPLGVTFLVVPNSYDERILDIIRDKQIVIEKAI